MFCLYNMDHIMFSVYYSKIFKNRYQVKHKDTELYTMDSDIKEKRARVEAMSEHMKNVQQELSITQNLVAARLKEIESENHLRMLAEREQGRINLQIKRKKDDIDEIKERQNTHENNMFRYTQKIEQIKQQMKWSQKVNSCKF